MSTEQAKSCQVSISELPLDSVPFTLRSKKMAAHIAMMSPERQEAFEIEMAQREARLSLQKGQEDARQGPLIEPLDMGMNIEEHAELQDSKDQKDYDPLNQDNKPSLGELPENSDTLVWPSASLVRGEGSRSRDALKLPIQSDPLRRKPPSPMHGVHSSSKYLKTRSRSPRPELSTSAEQIEREYSCQMCGDRFKTTQNLMNHLAVHAGNWKISPNLEDREDLD